MPKCSRVSVACSLVDIGFSALQVRSGAFLPLCYRIIEATGKFWPVGLLSGDLAVLVPADIGSECEGLCECPTPAWHQSCISFADRLLQLFSLHFTYFIVTSLPIHSHILMFCLSMSFLFFCSDTFAHLESLFSADI